MNLRMIVLQTSRVKARTRERSREARLSLLMSLITFQRRNPFKVTFPIRLIYKTLYLEWLQVQPLLNESEKCQDDRSIQSLSNRKEVETLIMTSQDHLLTRYLSKHTCSQTPKAGRVEGVCRNITQVLHIQETKVLMLTQSLIFKNRRT